MNSKMRHFIQLLSSITSARMFIPRVWVIDFTLTAQGRLLWERTGFCWLVVYKHMVTIMAWHRPWKFFLYFCLAEQIVIVIVIVGSKSCL
uniref:Uncharacterized protein n=1 Tax=Kalanchoe fedtschenkoi TaxID=63787 RepID=A0A7N0VBV5_KALFE